MTLCKKAVCGAVLLLTLSSAGVGGCGNRNASPGPSPGDGRLQAHQAGPGARQNGRSDAKAVGTHLERLARGVAGVKDANCVVFGKYAIVGIDVDPKMERSRVGTIKYAVAEAFRKDPYGVDALVTADIDMAQRLREMRADIARGRPVAGFTEELADIVGRLVPQIPRNIAPRQSAGNTPPAGAQSGQR